MPIKTKLVILFLTLSTATLKAPPAYAADAREVESLVSGFPTLDELESHLSAETPPGRAESQPPLRVNANSSGAEGSILPVSARWFTAPPAPDPFTAPVSSPGVQPGERPLALSLADIDEAQREAANLAKEITAKNNLPINKYLLDRVGTYARTDYGTSITGLFVNGIGFGSLQQTIRQNYGAAYVLPLLQRFSGSTKWTRVLSGWTFSSTVSAMPALSQALQLQQFLNNLQLSWSVSLSWNLGTTTVRKIIDGQFDQEAAMGKAAGRAAGAREELLKTMALRIDALSRNRPVSDTRLTSLRELYPQFELYQARFEQAASCDERMENFFTLKGLALSLLTLAGYDRPDVGESSLLQTWKRARYTGCGGT